MITVTGTINNWHIAGNRIVGQIYGDVLKRFPDGAQITTSNMLPMSMQVSSPKCGAIIHTANSSYLLAAARSDKK